jgi:hypothetical protein
MKDGPVHDEVIRGLRWGAILVAALAICVACYRIARETPPAQAAPQAATSTVAAPLPMQGPIVPQTKPVPAPPPIRKVARNIARPAFLPTPVAMPPVEARAVDEPAPIIETPSQPPIAAAPEIPVPTVASPQEPEQVQDSRSRRWLKAVGRWVRVIVKN